MVDLLVGKMGKSSGKLLVVHWGILLVDLSVVQKVDLLELPLGRAIKYKHFQRYHLETTLNPM
jgi:hypothetical protein